MKKAPRPFRGLSTGSLVALLCHCGGSQTAHPIASTVTTPVATPIRAAAPLDVSEVPQPPQVVVISRIASWGAIVERIASVTGLGDVVRTGATEFVNESLHEMAPVVDRDGPVDFVVLMAPGPSHDAHMAFALNTGAVDDVERQLAHAYRFTSVGNGVSRLDPVESGNDHHGHSSSDLHCYAAPTPNPRVGRLVCSDSAAALEGITPFLARTLTRHPTAPDAILVDVAAGPLRDAFAADAVREISAQRDQFDRTVSTGTDITDPAARQALISLAHELLDALQGLITDPTALQMSLAFSQERVQFGMSADLHNPTQSVLRAFTETVLNPQPVPASLLSHLMPGAWLYEVGSMDSRPLRTLVTQIVEIGNQLIAHEPGLDEADRAALRVALTGLDHVDQESFGVAVGNDDAGHFWLAGSSHATTLTPASQVGDLRAMVAVLRRPHIARILQGQLRNLTPATHTAGHHAGAPATAAPATPPRPEIDLSSLRELPTRGLPAGSYAVELPAFEHLFAPSPSAASAAPPGRHHAAPHVRHQLALVPEGADLAVLVGTNVLDLYARYHANTTAGVDPAVFTAPSTFLSAAIVPAAIANLVRQTSPEDAERTAAALQSLPDHGSTPVLIRMGASQANGITHLSYDVDLSMASVRNYVSLATQPAPAPVVSSAPPAPPPHHAGHPAQHPRPHH